MPDESAHRPISLLRALLSRRVLDRRITSAAILAGVLLGAIIGAVAGSFPVGVLVGLVLGYFLPGLIAYPLDRSGRLPDGARYTRLSLKDLRTPPGPR